MQLRDLREYCRARGLEIVAEYVDRISGAKERRPGLDALMDAARKRRIDLALVWRFDRFARSTRHLIQALDEFRALGVGFVSFQEAIDTSTPMGVAMFTIISALAQLERSTLRERIMGGLRLARAKGRRPGPRPTIDPKAVQAMREQGMTLSQIAEKLSCTKGAVSKSLSRHRSRSA